MPVRAGSSTYKGGFHGVCKRLAAQANDVAFRWRADVYILVLRGDKWYSLGMLQRHARPAQGSQATPEAGSARKQKEGFRRQRESMMGKSDQLSSRYHATVLVYLTRNMRWYSDERYGRMKSKGAVAGTVRRQMRSGSIDDGPKPHQVALTTSLLPRNPQSPHRQPEW